MLGNTCWGALRKTMTNLSQDIELDVCVTVQHQYSDVNNQQDAKTFSFINLFKSAQHVLGNKFAHNLSLQCIVPKSVYRVKKFS